jgi:hypothetical protein
MSDSKNGGGRKPPVFPAGKYKCPKCSNRIGIAVNMSAPPTCGKHSTGPVVMEVTK